MSQAILVSGSDALKFLQGQLTCDMALLKVDHPLRGSHCNQKGRVEAIYDIFLSDVGIFLATPDSVIVHALEKLKFYARFSKVDLHILDLPTSIEYKQVMPRLYPETVGRYLPQELGLDQEKETVSFTKGCYLGQEIVARLHYLGKLKKMPKQLTLSQAVQPGTEIADPQYGQVEVMDCNGLEAVVLVKMQHTGEPA